jgi:tRNA-splicing ligase RtcB
MHHNQKRLIDAFSKQGIRLQQTTQGWHVQNEHASAEIFLPATLPLEDKAVNQLLNFASVHASCQACATPDFHPGTHAPVGSVVATDMDVVIPRAIGTDINCGMRLLNTGLSLDQCAPHKQSIVQEMRNFLLNGQRNVPLRVEDFKRLYNDGPKAFMEGWSDRDFQFKDVNRAQRALEWDSHVSLFEWKSDAKHAPELHTQSSHGWIRDPQLGTPGSGNHFVEVQVVDALSDRKRCFELGLKEGTVLLMLHTGSRDVGFYVGGRWMDKAKDQWPSNVPHPKHGLYAIEGKMAQEYLQAMGTASLYAWLNRFTIDECMRQAWEKAIGAAQWKLIVDVPHNVVSIERGKNIHRKGATPAHAGQLGVIPGSMGDASYLVEGMGNDDWLHSCSHGAGRSMRRQSMRQMQHDSRLSFECITASETRTLEEHPSAYKPIGEVIQHQVEHRTIRSVARVRPWFTFKT